MPAIHAAEAGASLRVISKRELASLRYELDEVLQVVQGAYRAVAEGRSANPAKLTVKPPDGRCVAYAMLGRDGDRGTVAVKTSYKHGPEGDKADQRYYTTLSLYDEHTGLPIALMDCSLVGSLRTPAASALIAQACARPGASTALVVGCGVQGTMALPFLVRRLPGLQRLIVHGHHVAGIDAVLSAMHQHHPGRQVEVSHDLRRAAQEADIVVGAAGPASPEAVDASWLRPGALCILVGYGIDRQALHRADWRVATSAEQMQVTGTDLAVDGVLPAINAELPQILVGTQPGRRDDHHRVFAYNSGMVVTDIALGRLMAERALAQGLGREVALW
ncbi:ornithine cyclodeaminase family protein [Ideonella sp. BN130291]|uniref:ornithine cyclodeaminase family protein n=1 Tax=Ideonella sp. BN130291 TaxID=3112940 RepID=UPI002E25C7A7|nr:ornithine cyclodeaminase family protein [Ideonella sp. BN130291]